MQDELTALWNNIEQGESGVEIFAILSLGKWFWKSAKYEDMFACLTNSFVREGNFRYVT